MLQVGAGQPHGRDSSASSNVTHISPYLPHPAPSSQPRHAARFASGRAGRASISCWASPPFETFRRRHCSAVALIGPTSALQPVLFTVCRLWCRRHLTGATHTSRQAPPSPPHAGVSMPSRSQAKTQHNAGTRYQTRSTTAFLQRKGRQPLTVLVWLLPWFHRASSAAG